MTATSFCAQAIFSASLLHCSYATKEQRKLMVLAISEDGNRVSVVEELRELVSRKEHFTSTATQELRMPLHRIIGLSGSLLSGYAGDLGHQV